MGRLHRPSLGNDVQTKLDQTEHLGRQSRWNVEPAMILPLHAGEQGSDRLF
jgi:hypothetical protein